MYLNSAREGCVLNSLSVSGEAKSWERAVIALAEEVGGLVSAPPTVTRPQSLGFAFGSRLMVWEYGGRRCIADMMYSGCTRCVGRVLIVQLYAARC
eukprot:3101981-Rhodomonas_salina.1